MEYRGEQRVHVLTMVEQIKIENNARFWDSHGPKVTAALLGVLGVIGLGILHNTEQIEQRMYELTDRQTKTETRLQATDEQVDHNRNEIASTRLDVRDLWRAIPEKSSTE